MHKKSTPSNNVFLNCAAIASKKAASRFVYLFSMDFSLFKAGNRIEIAENPKNADPRQQQVINPIFTI
jgi:hypothetical protein